MATIGSISHAHSAHEYFVRQVEVFERNGVTLSDALAAPLVVTVEGGQEMIDNPLKYDDLQVGEAVNAVRGTELVGTALELVTFIFVPLLFLLLGAYIANYDRTSGTAALRASRERWPTVTAAKALALGVVAVLVAIATAIVALAAAMVSAPTVRGLAAAIPYELVVPTPVASIAVKIAMTAVVAFFFGVVGYAVGWLARSSSWPMVLAAMVLFLVPFVSRWDPRNLLAVLGQHVYDFWGPVRVETTRGH